MTSTLAVDQQYRDWLIEVKNKVRNAQIKAAVRVNRELLTLYWELGADIVAKQATATWGDGFLQQLSKDLMTEFPDLKGFSKRNLEIIRQWYLFYNQPNQLATQSTTPIAKQAVSQLASSIAQSSTSSWKQQLAEQIMQIPWGHNVAIIAKCKNLGEALYYVQNTIQYNWSRAVLIHQIESKLYQREGKAITNFALTLPKPQSDLAQQTLKDPYLFDFLHLTKDYTERDLENGLIEHITKFLLELGAGFSFLGRTIAEYALRDIHKPIGVSEYQLTQSLPDDLKASLPSIEEIERELESMDESVTAHSGAFTAI